MPPPHISNWTSFKPPPPCVSVSGSGILSIIFVLVQFVVVYLPPLLRKSRRFISRAMAASVHPTMMVCTPTSLATLCRGGISQPRSNPTVRNTPLLRFVTHEGRQLRLGRCWFVEVGRTDRVIVSSLDVCLASAAALAGTS